MAEIKECERATLFVSVVPGTGTLDVTETHVVITGTKPEDEWWFTPDDPDGRKFWEWNPVICEWTNITQCQYPAENVPKTFVIRVPIVANDVGNLTATFFPDNSALHYALDVAGGGAELAEESVRVLEADRKVWAETHRCRPTPPHDGPVCTPVLNRDLPQPWGFGVFDKNGRKQMLCGAHVGVHAGDTVELLIRPLPITTATYAAVLPHIMFTGFIRNWKVAQYPVDIDKWDPDRWGYPVRIGARDEGAYELHLHLQWYYGEHEIGTDPAPILLGAHTAHLYSECNAPRALVFGCDYVVDVTEPTRTLPAITSGEKRCQGGEDRGRWVAVPLYDCALPHCTGDRKNTKIWHHFTGHHLAWVWTPYTCHYRAFNTTDISTCVAETGTQWFHVMGDSIVREMATVFYDQYKQIIIGRFEEDDKYLGDPPLRISFQFQNFMYSLDFFGRRDIKDDADLMDSWNITCPEGSERCPDVLLINPAMAYVAWKMTQQAYEEWFPKLVEYLKLAMAAPKGPRKNPLRVIWYHPPYNYGQAHSRSSPYITSQRLMRMSEFSLPLLRAAGVEILDAFAMTRGVPEASWDGTHYLRIGAEAHGAYSNMIANIFINMVFRDCSLP